MKFWVSSSSQNSSSTSAQPRRDAAQVGQLLGQQLHVGFRQDAEDLLGHILADGDQQNGGLAHAGHVP